MNAKPFRIVYGMRVWVSRVWWNPSFFCTLPHIFSYYMILCTWLNWTNNRISAVTSASNGAYRCTKLKDTHIQMAWNYFPEFVEFIGQPNWPKNAKVEEAAAAAHTAWIDKVQLLATHAVHCYITFVFAFNRFVIV